MQVFNVAEYRQRMCGGLKDAEWFDPNNAEALKLRTQCNKAAIIDMISFISSNTHAIAILDSTNPTYERRSYLLKMVCSTSITSVSPLTGMSPADAAHRRQSYVHRSPQR